MAKPYFGRMYYFFSLLMSHICVRLSKRMGGGGGGSYNHNRICIGCYTMDRMNFEFLYKLLWLTMPYMYVRACLCVYGARINGLSSKQHIRSSSSYVRAFEPNTSQLLFAPMELN